MLTVAARKSVSSRDSRQTAIDEPYAERAGYAGRAILAMPRVTRRRARTCVNWTLLALSKAPGGRRRDPGGTGSSIARIDQYYRFGRAAG